MYSGGVYIAHHVAAGDLASLTGTFLPGTVPTYVYDISSISGENWLAANRLAPTWLLRHTNHGLTNSIGTVPIVYETGLSSPDYYYGSKTILR